MKRILVLGDEAVGKTTLIARATGRDFEGLLSETSLTQEHLLTLSQNKNSNKNKNNFANEETNVTICFYDTSGQQNDHQILSSQLYQQASVFVLCYSIISPTSYSNAKNKWLQEIERNVSADQKKTLIVVGTKKDLREDEELLERLAERSLSPLTTKLGKELAKLANASHFLELSAHDPEANSLFLNSITNSIGITKKNKSTNLRCDIA